MPTYSLLRGETVVGKFDGRSPVSGQDVTVGWSGFLEVAEGVSITPVFQTRMQWPLGGRRVFQDSLPLEVPGQVVTHESEPGRTRVSTRVELGWGQAKSEAEARGVAPELVYRIRMPDGTLVEPTLLTIEKENGELPDDPVERAEIERVMGQDGYVWIIMFAVEPEDEASPPER
jgi:hypothetical protein